MALESYETALGWLGSGNRKSIIRVLFDYMQLCTSKLDFYHGRGLNLLRLSLNLLRLASLEFLLSLEFLQLNQVEEV